MQISCNTLSLQTLIIKFMNLFSSKSALLEALEGCKKNSMSVGFVPTMGALHMGHLSLVKRAFEENTCVVVSIFINPTQFNNPEDLEQYPTTLDSDLNLLASISEQILIYTPTVQDVYGLELRSQSFDFGGLEYQMEGRFRPGHFDGVGTVVRHLFEIINPNRAYFGEKDFQQLQIIKQLVKITGLKVEIIGCPIVRESNGLAMSSRNERLSTEHRQESAFIYQTLQNVKQQSENQTLAHIKSWVSDQFDLQPLFHLEYFEIVDANSLQPVDTFNHHFSLRAFIAAEVEGVRLIDNIALN